MKKRNLIKDHLIKFSFYFNNKRIKIQLKDQQDQYFQKYQENEEGYSSEQIMFRRDGSKIFLHTTIKGKDCDGLLIEYFDYICDQKNLKKGNKGTPNWELIDNYQKDQFAELMNY